MPNTSNSEQDMLDTAKPWLERNKHVTPKVPVLDWGSALTKITTAATSGEGHDLLQRGTTWTPAVAAMGAGGNELTADNKQAAVNSNEAVEGLTPKALLEKNTADVDNAFHAGEFSVWRASKNKAAALDLLKYLGS